MRSISVLSLAAVALSVGGCKGGAMVKAQEEFANKACACKDLDCIKKLQAEQVAWVKKNGQAAAGSEADGEKIVAANNRLTACVSKVVKAAARGAGAGGSSATGASKTGASKTGASKPAGGAATDKPATASSAGQAGALGVPECDDYLSKYSACLTSAKNIPAVALEAMKKGMETVRASWAAAAKTAVGKAGLATGCKSALKIAKQAMARYKCNWGDASGGTAGGTSGASGGSGGSGGSGASGGAASASGKASHTECDKMMRHGIMIKVGKGPFGRLSKAKQKKKLDEIMGAPKMVAALKQCTTLVTKKLANCIIGAKTSAEFKACKRLE